MKHSSHQVYCKNKQFSKHEIKLLKDGSKAACFMGHRG